MGAIRRCWTRPGCAGRAAWVRPRVAPLAGAPGGEGSRQYWLWDTLSVQAWLEAGGDRAGVGVLPVGQGGRDGGSGVAVTMALSSDALCSSRPPDRAAGGPVAGFRQSEVPRTGAGSRPAGTAVKYASETFDFHIYSKVP